jgi:hypothetical protein
MRKSYLIACALILGTTFGVQAQAPTMPGKLSPDLIQFFVGHWTGSGAFANGKKIEADVSFELTLDSCWIRYEHADKAPNAYKALSMWGVDAQTGQFLAYGFDNFHGHRNFSSNGWINNKLILSISEFWPKVGVVFQHFIYEKLSDASFKMTYEVSGDGINWKLGDSLVFNRA